MEIASSREKLSSQKRRDSLYENFVFLEAVTVRKKLEKLKRKQSLDGEFHECWRVCVCVCVCVCVRERVVCARKRMCV